MITNENRIGKFTSSEIWKLMKDGRKKGEPGAPFLDYVMEKRFEKKLKRSIDAEVTARPLSWGKCLEKKVFAELGIRYRECSVETIVHPEYSFWAGSPDGTKDDNGVITIAEIKCPYTLKSFCQFVDYEGDGYEIIGAIRENHNDGEKYYWQCISNAILTGASVGELIIYMPYKHELSEIKQLACNMDSFDQWRYKWIDTADEEELPYLVKEGVYKNLNVIRWEINPLDKEALTERVLMASKML